jgi:hypothetical protein
MFRTSILESGGLGTTGTVPIPLDYGVTATKPGQTCTERGKECRIMMVRAVYTAYNDLFTFDVDLQSENFVFSVSLFREH